MKMSNNPTKYEVLIKQYLRSVLDISEYLVSEMRYCPELIFKKLFVTGFPYTVISPGISGTIVCLSRRRPNRAEIYRINGHEDLIIVQTISNFSVVNFQRLRFLFCPVSV